MQTSRSSGEHGTEPVGHAPEAVEVSTTSRVVDSTADNEVFTEAVIETSEYRPVFGLEGLAEEP